MREISFRPLSGTVFPKFSESTEYLVNTFRFRPLSGTVFPKLDRMRRERKYKARVSVPSRGLYFLNCVLKTIEDSGEIKFPSPLGDCIS